MTLREEATAELLYFIDQLFPNTKNREIYQKRLSAMSNRQFEEFLTALETGDEVLAGFLPNFDETKIDIERNTQITETLGGKMHHRLRLTDRDTGQVRLTPIEHMVVEVPLRRQAQMLYKKISIPENNQVIDERSGQPTGPSKGASVSYPELQVNAGKGLKRMVLELIKARGGDERLYNAMNRSIIETGGVRLDSLEASMPTTVKANDILSVYLTAAHLGNNL